MTLLEKTSWYKGKDWMALVKGEVPDEDPGDLIKDSSSTKLGHTKLKGSIERLKPFIAIHMNNDCSDPYWPGSPPLLPGTGV